MVFFNSYSSINEMKQRHYSDHPFTTINLSSYINYGRSVSVESFPNICMGNVEVSLISDHLNLLTKEHILDSLLKCDPYLPIKTILN